MCFENQRNTKSTLNAAFKHDDAGSYDNLVDKFDYFTQKYTYLIPDFMLRQIKINENDKLLDVGTGTGIVPHTISIKLSNSVDVTAIDLSDEMLKVAKSKDLGNPKITYKKMDAENLEFNDCEFEFVLSLYALRHFPNPERSIAEIHRVLTENGTAVVAVGSRPQLMTLDGLKAGARKLSSIIHKSLGKELQACDHIDRLTRQHLPNSKQSEVAEWTKEHKGFSAPLEKMFRDARFKIRGVHWTGQWSTVDSIDEFYELQTTFSSYARKRINEADKASVDKLKLQFRRDCEQVLNRNGRLVYQSGAAVIVAQK